ncbi:XtrA/YqaO family protein [Fictibacillus enclensis]|uniref:XtrA/YqaO family protein n=1 Tax=Fictibacillus enclensis TaxID=1017270 RepID=UPI0025A0515D|nr:XtrA/YqaO family protein [Fictibacillus enclensis]MDM5335732.1 XtrA/YqaO family protein [Fictibacillus enclensis]
MRLSDLEINPSTHKLEIDIMDISSSCVIVVSSGKARMAQLPTHGETKFVTHQGKVKRVKWVQGEDF